MKNLDNNYLNTDNINGLMGTLIHVQEGKREMKIIPISMERVEGKQIGQARHFKLTFQFFEKERDYYMIDGSRLATLAGLNPEAFRVMERSYLQKEYDRNYQGRDLIALAKNDVVENRLAMQRINKGFDVSRDEMREIEKKIKYYLNKTVIS